MDKQAIFDYYFQNNYKIILTLFCAVAINIFERMCFIMTKVDLASESKHDKFVRIVEARTNKAAEMIRLIGNCASKSSYDYSEREVKMIFDYLEKEIKNARNKFNGSDSEEGKFSLR